MREEGVSEGLTSGTILSVCLISIGVILMSVPGMADFLSLDRFERAMIIVGSILTNVLLIMADPHSLWGESRLAKCLVFVIFFATIITFEVSILT